MNLFIYSDESGTFSKKSKLFLFAGYIFVSKEQKDKHLFWFKQKEKAFKIKNNISNELKGSKITIEQKATLTKKLNNVFKFSVVINIKDIYDSILSSKRTKQRYLDFAYKLGLKNALNKMIRKRIINPDEVTNMFIFQDEHTTATDGFYELKSSLKQEFKDGIIDIEGFYHEPLFKNLKSLEVKLCNSKNNTLIRASDLLCNLIWTNINNDNKIRNLLINNLCIIELPRKLETFKFKRPKIYNLYDIKQNIAQEK